MGFGIIASLLTKTFWTWVTSLMVHANDLLVATCGPAPGAIGYACHPTAPWPAQPGVSCHWPHCHRPRCPLRSNHWDGRWYWALRGWVGSCLVAWFCYQLMARPDNRAAASPSFVPCTASNLYASPYIAIIHAVSYWQPCNILYHPDNFMWDSYSFIDMYTLMFLYTVPDFEGIKNKLFYSTQLW